MTCALPDVLSGLGGRPGAPGVEAGRLNCAGLTDGLRLIGDRRAHPGASRLRGSADLGLLLLLGLVQRLVLFLHSGFDRVDGAFGRAHQLLTAGFGGGGDRVDDDARAGVLGVGQVRRRDVGQRRAGTGDGLAQLFSGLGGFGFGLPRVGLDPLGCSDIGVRCRTRVSGLGGRRFRPLWCFRRRRWRWRGLLHRRPRCRFGPDRRRGRVTALATGLPDGLDHSRVADVTLQPQHPRRRAGSRLAFRRPRRWWLVGLRRCLVITHLLLSSITSRDYGRAAE